MKTKLTGTRLTAENAKNTERKRNTFRAGSLFAFFAVKFFIGSRRSLPLILFVLLVFSFPAGAAVSNITFIAEANISIHATNNVAGNSVDVGISGSAGGETNYLGEVSNTNATKMGLAYGKAGVTNQLRSVEAGNGLTSTNQGTNIIFGVNTFLANLLGANGNLVTNGNANQFSIASGLLNWITGGWQTNLNAQGPGTNNGNFYAISFNGTGAGNAALALQGTDGNIYYGTTKGLFIYHTAAERGTPVVKEESTRFYKE